MRSVAEHVPFRTFRPQEGNLSALPFYRGGARRLQFSSVVRSLNLDRAKTRVHEKCAGFSDNPPYPQCDRVGYFAVGARLLKSTSDAAAR